MRQPHVPEKSVIPLLVEDQLAVAPQAGVHLAVSVEVRGKVPRAVMVVEVEDGTFADVDEKADVFAASTRYLLALKSDTEVVGTGTHFWRC